MRPAGWCQPKGRIGAAPGATEPMGERGKCLYTLKNTSKSRRSAQNTKKSISNSNNEPNFTLHEISGLKELIQMPPTRSIKEIKKEYLRLFSSKVWNAKIISYFTKLYKTLVNRELHSALPVFFGTPAFQQPIG